MSARDRKGGQGAAVLDGDELLSALVSGPSAASPDSLAGIVIGELVAMTDDGRTPLVLFPGQGGAAAVIARSVVDLHGAHIGRQVALMFEGADRTKPIVMGVLRDQAGWPLADRPGQVSVDADGERMVVTAREQLVLRCGKASITLTKAGKVLVEGTYSIEPIVRREPRQGRINPAQLVRPGSTSMQLINATRLVTGFTMGLEPNGRELLIVVVKGTFTIPQGEEPVRLAEEQVPLLMADTFSGEPALSAPVYEVDFAPRKHRCDVLLNGSAHAPGGRPAARVEVGLRVNGMSKTFAVVGDRRWEAGVSGIGPSPAVPFTTMPISYDRAFGGVDNRDQDPGRHAAFMSNPVGRGFHKHLRADWVHGTPLPNTEESAQSVTMPNSEKYWPMAFGPVGRGWDPRRKLAGTYDDEWLAKHFPFLPPDFDERYFQAAPADQQVPHPQGGEDVVLLNLTPEGRIAFNLPTFDAPIHFFTQKGDREDGRLILDTIVLEPDQRRFQLTWRATRPLRKNMYEVAQVLVGRKPGAWWAEREKVEFPIKLTPVRVTPAED